MAIPEMFLYPFNDKGLGKYFCVNDVSRISQRRAHYGTHAFTLTWPNLVSQACRIVFLNSVGFLLNFSEPNIWAQCEMHLEIAFLAFYELINQVAAQAGMGNFKFYTE